MIRRSFIILPSVGRATEIALWKRGISEWDSFINAKSIIGFSGRRKEKCDRILQTAQNFLDSGYSQYFVRMLPSLEYWRLYSSFEKDAAYIDIETDGLHQNCRLTMVGIHRKGETRVFIRGYDLNEENLREFLLGCKMLVSFNGSSFDLPILRRYFPFSIPDVPHFDLRHACSRIGMTGGLKNVERLIGIKRDRPVEFLTGEHAAYLWRLWEKKGSRNALELLKRYNEEDTRNLVTIAKYAYRQLEDKLIQSAGMQE
ncbi:MAG: ribonuclease H-like domain-containing protein [Methanomassiliicoccales archaeon]|jgi:uncharacterized protein YprB with RNaseH-like and TPR domain|nr:ribonuclease H-like domain-containing protein [Methanomassiliicoccales archaeon]